VTDESIPGRAYDSHCAVHIRRSIGYRREFRNDVYLRDTSAYSAHIIRRRRRLCRIASIRDGYLAIDKRGGADARIRPNECAFRETRGL
jgi:hypothetical protein